MVTKNAKSRVVLHDLKRDLKGIRVREPHGDRFELKNRSIVTPPTKGTNVPFVSGPRDYLCSSCVVLSILI